MALLATYAGANGWLLEFEQPGASTLRVLLDPWLVGELRFLPGDWFFTGRQRRPQPIPEAIDLLLLTQGLPDHAHPPTLAAIPRSVPVVGSAAAAAIVRGLGYTTVTELRPGESTTVLGQLTITATAGAAVPQLENGYLLHHPAGRLYVEPHGFLPPVEALPAEPLDAVITPVVDLGLPLAGAFVRGRSVLPELLERFRPATVLASSAGGEITYEGLLSRLVWQKGSCQETACELPSGVQLINPVPGERQTLPVRVPAA
jgi:L-ascorbate metabolism protein UlaG (beta-lactamase superfamily)